MAYFPIFRHFAYREGHVAKSDLAMEMYYEMARQPNIRTICETGFNAGHSSAIFLVANPQARIKCTPDNCHAVVSRMVRYPMMV